MKTNHLAIVAAVLILGAAVAYFLATGTGAPPAATGPAPATPAVQADTPAAPGLTPAPQGVPETAGCTQYTLKAAGWVCSSSDAVKP